MLALDLKKENTMSESPFFKRIKTCEAKYETNETVRYVIFSTTNNLFLGVVIYMGRQLKNGSVDNDTHEQHFPSDTEKQAIDSCETWIKENISDSITMNCT